MSVQGNYAGNLQVPVSQALTDTSTTKIGDTATDDSLTLASVAFCNDNGGSVTCQLHWYDSVNTTEYLVWQGAVSDNETKIVDNLPLRLVEGDEIRATGNSGVTVTVIYMLNFALSR